MISLDESKFIFEERKEEVKKFSDFLNLLINKRPVFKVDDEEISIEISLTHILKAQGYLILYNLVESTIANTISSVHYELYQKEISFDGLPKNLQKNLLQQLCKEGFSSIAPIDSNSTLSNEIIKNSYNKKVLFSGNIDRQFVTKLSQNYGFQTENTEFKKTGHGIFMTQVKEQRNNLAHGNISFTECGRNTSIDELLRAFEQIPNFLDDFISKWYGVVDLIGIQDLRGIMDKYKITPDMRAIVFCKTREMTMALLKWIEQTPELAILSPNRLVGANASAEKGGKCI
jgi:hypothetical protein